MLISKVKAQLLIYLALAISCGERGIYYSAIYIFTSFIINKLLASYFSYPLYSAINKKYTL